MKVAYLLLIPVLVFLLSAGAASALTVTESEMRTLQADAMGSYIGHGGQIAHDQPNPTPVTAELKQMNIGTALYQFGYLVTSGLGINLYFDAAVADKGHNLGKNDYICVGDELEFEKLSLSGEWYYKGGPTDSPPVKWVSDIEAVKQKIESGSYSAKTYPAYICGFVPGARMAEGLTRCFVSAAVICSENCREGLSPSLEKVSERRYKVVKEGDIVLGAGCDSECVLFIDRKNLTYVRYDMKKRTQSEIKLPDAYGYMTIDKTYNMTDRFDLKAKKSAERPRFGITGVHIPGDVSENSPFIIRAEVKNSGKAEGTLDDVRLNAGNYRILYKPKSIPPGQTGEILVQLSMESAKSTQLKLVYSSDKLGCLATKGFSATYNIGALSIGKGRSCSSDRDCSAGQTCCVGACRPSSKGVCDDIDGDGEPDTWVEV
jgi:uncharacterized protein YjbK